MTCVGVSFVLYLPLSADFNKANSARSRVSLVLIYCVFCEKRGLLN